MEIRASKKLKALRVLIALLLLPVALLVLLSIYSNVTNSEERHYEKMKQACEAEMWAVVSDSPWLHVQEINKPYPADRQDLSTGGPVVGIVCSRQEAIEQKESLDRSSNLFFFLGMAVPLTAPIVLILLVWWIIEETKYWLDWRGAKNKQKDEVF